MSQRIWIAALTTGAFCAVFTLVIDQLVSMASTGQIVLLAATSGFLGSLFASFVLRRR